MQIYCDLIEIHLPGGVMNKLKTATLGHLLHLFTETSIWFASVCVFFFQLFNALFANCINFFF